MAKKKIEQDISILTTNSTKEIMEAEEQLDSDSKLLTKAMVIKMIVAVAAVVAVVIIGIVVGTRLDKKRVLREPDESMSAFYNAQTEATITTDRVEAVVTEAYYTNERGLQLVLNFGNGFKQEQRLAKIFVTIRDNDEKGDVIAAGNTDKIGKKAIVPANGNLDFELYLPPEFVKMKNNSLEKIYYDITVDHTSVE